MALTGIARGCSGGGGIEGGRVKWWDSLEGELSRLGLPGIQSVHLSQTGV